MSTFETYYDVRFLKGNVVSERIDLTIYVYEVDGVMIDAGPKSLAKSIQAFLQETAPTQVALTHLHEDHCGMAGWIQKHMQVPIFLHPMSVEDARTGISIPPYRVRFWGEPDPFEAIPIPSTFSTDHLSFQVIETPGHTADHIVLYEPNRGWLFSGDLFLAPKVRIVMRQESMPVLMKSLRRVLELDFDTLFCGHAGIFPGGKKLLQQKLENLEETEHRVFELYERGWSLRQITRHLFPKRPPIYYSSQGEWSSTHIVRTLLAQKCNDMEERK